MITRRRFLTISASACMIGAPAAQARQIWRGRAFGADVSIVLHGEDERTGVALTAATDTIKRMERLFSLYDPASALSELNRNGTLSMPPEFSRLIAICNDVHEMTQGLFDPTVQPLFAAAKIKGSPVTGAERKRFQSLIGWQKVTRSGNTLSMKASGMALTLNGIAQGFATDRVVDALAAHGFEDATVNIGEYRTVSRSGLKSILNTDGEVLGSVRLKNAAIATTSAAGYTFADGSSHILAPGMTAQKPAWNTVSVVAKTAAMADGLSTALALTPDDTLARSLVESGRCSGVLLEQKSGEIYKIGTV